MIYKVLGILLASILLLFACTPVDDNEFTDRQDRKSFRIICYGENGSIFFDRKVNNAYRSKNSGNGDVIYYSNNTGKNKFSSVSGNCILERI